MGVIGSVTLDNDNESGPDEPPMTISSGNDDGLKHVFIALKVKRIQIEVKSSAVKLEK